METDSHLDSVVSFPALCSQISLIALFETSLLSGHIGYFVAAVLEHGYLGP